MTDDDPADRPSVEAAWQARLASAPDLPFGAELDGEWARRYTKAAFGDPAFLDDPTPDEALSAVADHLDALPPATFAAGAAVATRHPALARDLDGRDGDWAGRLVDLAAAGDVPPTEAAGAAFDLDDDDAATLAAVGAEFAAVDDGPLCDALLALAEEGLAGERPGPATVAPGVGGASAGADGLTDRLADRETDGHPAAGADLDGLLDR